MTQTAAEAQLVALPCDCVCGMHAAVEQRSAGMLVWCSSADLTDSCVHVLCHPMRRFPLPWSHLLTRIGCGSSQCRACLDSSRWTGASHSAHGEQRAGQQGGAQDSARRHAVVQQAAEQRTTDAPAAAIRSQQSPVAHSARLCAELVSMQLHVHAQQCTCTGVMDAWHPILYARCARCLQSLFAGQPKPVTCQPWRKTVLSL